MSKVMNTNSTKTLANDDLFLQIRTAHRLLAAYYQRLLPTLQAIADELEMTYLEWKPELFNRPGSTRKNIFEQSQWNLLPAMTTRYLFCQDTLTDKIKVGQYIMDFLVVSDTGIDFEAPQRSSTATRCT
ncbi:MAG: hypothetical protein ACI8WB_005518 [Phenylobacterium sp.]|jgi:hypothetical protein